MYSKKIIDQNIDKFEAAQGWRPVAHTFEEVQEFSERISALIKTENNSRNMYIELVGEVSREEAKEIHRWIQNEQVLCVLDCSYWENNYVYVRDERGELVKFKNRRSQDLFDHILADCDEKQVAVQLLIMASRQSGISTKSLLKLTHRTLFHPYTQSIAASPTHAMAELTSRIAETAVSGCPWWLVPQKMPKGKFSNESQLSFQAGQQPTGMCRGLTPMCVYVDGIADYKSPIRTFEEGLFRSMFETSKTLMILHGSIGGESSWSKCLWDAAKQMNSRLKAIYIPWTVSTDIYPRSEFLKEHPIPAKWKPAKETVDHRIRCEGYIRKTPYLSDFMGADWTMSFAQQWFYEVNYKQATASHTLERWKACMAADDDECIYLTEEMNREVEIDDLFPVAAETQKLVKAIA